ncbi:O-Antigen ligase [Marinomonas spartinae]|uniref:O-antigen ligase family protein n=1 Tax=Marinomonas spartinae TaxID=1792290 RepID=UPI000808A2C7|nr:O-antigen ligase family protein [Marinomonas spartinae]SBS35864.1 O-Antigen ligase [Marinomonas spartinae]
MTRLNHTQQGNRLAIIGFTCTCLYALTKIHSPDTLSNAVGLAMVLLGLFAIYRYGKDLSIKIPMLLLFASVVIPLISWYFAHLAHPKWVDPYPKLDKLSRIFMFVPIAWWLKDSPKKVFLFWALAALTIIVSPWVGGGGCQEISNGFHGARIDFGLRNGEHASLFFGFVLLGLICFSSRLFKWSKLTLILWTPALCLCLYTVAASQTRACWLALIVTLITALTYYFLGNNKKYIKAKYLIITALVTLLAGSVIYKSMGHIIEKRVGAESGVIQHIIKGDLENVPYTSVGTRIHMWRASWEKIKERPLLGWGNEGQYIAIHDTNWMPEYIKQQFGHIHNIYIALLTDYGLIGFVFYFIWVGWLLIRVFKAVSKGYLRHDIGYFSLGAMTFWSIISLFESYLFFWTGVFCLQVIFGGLLALIWHAQILENKDNEAKQLS